MIKIKRGLYLSQIDLGSNKIRVWNAPDANVEYTIAVDKTNSKTKQRMETVDSVTKTDTSSAVLRASNSNREVGAIG